MIEIILAVVASGGFWKSLRDCCCATLSLRGRNNSIRESGVNLDSRILYEVTV